MLDNISQPVAFATAPLGELDIPTDAAAQSGSQTPPSAHVYGGIRRDLSVPREPVDERLLSKWTKKIGISQRIRTYSTPSNGRSTASKTATASSSFNEDEFDEDEFFEGGMSSVYLPASY